MDGIRKADGAHSQQRHRRRRTGPKSARLYGLGSEAPDAPLLGAERHRSRNGGGGGRAPAGVETSKASLDETEIHGKKIHAKSMEKSMQLMHSVWDLNDSDAFSVCSCKG